MFCEARLRMMQADYNTEENTSAQRYKDEFMYRVLSKELIHPYIPRLSRRSYRDTLIEATYANQNDSEFFVALREHTLIHNKHIFNYVRIATGHQYDHAGRQTVKILSLPLENVSVPLFPFQNMQCELINKYTCSINMFTLTEEGERFQLDYKVNLKNGDAERWANGRIISGRSAIKFWYNYARRPHHIIHRDNAFLESQTFKLLPDPLIWNE